MFASTMYAESSYRSVLSKKNEQEKTFKEFYSNIIQDIFNPDGDFLDEAMETSDILLYFLSGEPGLCISDAEECAFILHNSVIDSCFAMNKFHDTAMEYTQLIDIFSSKKSIKICCLGSQSIFALFGICKVLHGLSFACISVEVLDKCDQWAPLIESLLYESSNLIENLKLKFDFYSDDDLEKIRSKINSSDIVIAFKYFSRFSCEMEAIWTPKNILSNMKKKSVFFYADYDLLDVKSLFPRTSFFKEIKSSSLPEEYIISPHAENNIEGKTEIRTLVDVLLSKAKSRPLMFSVWFKNRKQERKLPVGMNMHKKLQ